MDNCALHARQRIGSGGIELSLLAIGGLKRGLVGPAYAEVNGQVANRLVIVLNVKRVGPPARLPIGLSLCKGGHGDLPQQEVGKPVARVRPEWEVGSAEVVSARGKSLDQRIVCGPHQLVAELHSVFGNNLGDIVLKRGVGATSLAKAARPEVVVATATAIENIRKTHRAHIGNAELFGPVAVCGRRTIGLIAGVPSETRLVDELSG